MKLPKMKTMTSDQFLEHVSSILKTSTKVVEKVREKRLVKEKCQEPRGQQKTQEENLPTLNEKILRIAHLELGTKENPGILDNNRIVEYHKFAHKMNTGEHPDSVPWCSSFVCWVVEKAGGESTNSMAARSWMRWGESSIHNPAPGDIVVFWRGEKNGWKGHVGIFLRRNDDGSIACLGGNQNDEVNVTFYSDSKLLGIRRAKGSEIDPGKTGVLSFLANAVINGKFLNSSQKVV